MKTTEGGVGVGVIFEMVENSGLKYSTYTYSNPPQGYFFIAFQKNYTYFKIMKYKTMHV